MRNLNLKKDHFSDFSWQTMLLMVNGLWVVHGKIAVCRDLVYSTCALIGLLLFDLFFPAHSYMTGTTACLGFGITAALMKIGNKEGWRLTGPPKL